MDSINEILRAWCAERPDGKDLIAVRVWRNGRLVARGEKLAEPLLMQPRDATRPDIGAINAANALTGAILGAARRWVKMERRNTREVK